MQTVRKLHWIILHLQCLLLGSFVDSSSLHSSTQQLQSIISAVGNQAVLPCSWKGHLVGPAPSTCHIIWATPVDTVFELRGEQKWEAEELEGRMEVPEERLVSGDCSLIISDVQIADGGRYESFMVVDGERARKTRVFIQSVRLSVLDHKSVHSRGPGEDFVLDLHTRHSVRVLFQARNSSDWLDLWMRGDEDTQRLEKHPLEEQLIIKTLKRSDDGKYKVLDENGLAVSTVQLSVEESSKALSVHQRLGDKVRTASSGEKLATRRYSALLLWSLLVTAVLSLHVC